MKLKLSTLVVIIGIIFFAYYYFIYTPCQAAKQPQRLPPPPEELAVMDVDAPSYSDGITMLDNDDSYAMQENFGVTMLDDYSEPDSRQAIQSTYDPDDIYELAGNIRPDNVMQVEEPVTML